MTLENGERLGRYELSAVLGRGGMGEVWRAEDSRLGRAVALKLLPEGFADDADRHARFEREARTLASLNHPNIATLFGLEHLDGQHVLVMELIEGEGLDERIARGPVPVEEALQFALQIAEALEAAHDAGIVHRDLKPANVRVRPDGTVKVLDFGLAKGWESETGESSLSLSPTITRHATAAGVILGTAAYMSPEQARGMAVDRRADIWAFGVVLWEMLSGRRMFGGDTVTDILANVLKQEIEWSELPAATPAALRRVLRRCLERRPGERIRDMGDVRWELAQILNPDAVELQSGAAEEGGRRRGQRVLPWLGGAVLALVCTAVIAWIAWPAGDPPRSVHASIVPPEGTTFNFHGSVGGPALSPDGSRLVFAAQSATGRSSLWVRQLEAPGAQKLSGTEGASYPFWSPDSRWIGFFVTGKLRRIDVNGGPPQTVCDAARGRGGSWSADGVIIFAPDVFSGLERVTATGGTPRPLIELDSSQGQSSIRWPAFLPDGRHFLYWAGGPLNSGEVETDGIYLSSLDGGGTSFLFPADSNALYSPPGHLLFLREQVLMVQPFDAEKRTLTGDAVPLVEHVANPENYRLGDFSVSQEGTLVCQTGEASLSQLVWLDAAGRQVGTVGEPAAIDGIRMSPRGNIIAEQVSDARSKNIDLWLVDLDRDVRTRFTFDPGVEINPVWSPDGERIAFSANRNGRMGVYVKSANGAGEATALVESDAGKFVADWSPDGRYLAFTFIDPHGGVGTDIWTLDIAGNGEPQPFLATRFNEAQASFSPDGRWLAYESNESGITEIYVTSFPDPGGKWQVSQDGGRQPLWRRDGRGVYYRALDGTLWLAPVETEAGAIEVGAPQLTVRAPNVSISGESHSYAVSPDGERFLFLIPEEASKTPLTLITNWTNSLGR